MILVVLSMGVQSDTANGADGMEARKSTWSMEEVYNTYFSSVYNYVFYRILDRETTEDIVSDVFMKVLRHLDRFDVQKASMKSWIMRIADRTLIDHYRRQRPSVSFDNEEAGVERLVPVQFEDQYEQLMSPARRELLAALKQLPERERLFIYYRYFLNITNRRIAREMNMKENTVSTVLHRARRNLRVLLQDRV